MGQYQYQKHYSHFTVSENKTEYVVECLHTGDISSSRLLNALEKRLRMQALDMVGTYQVYVDYAKKHNLTEDYFQQFAEYTSFTYNASVESFTSSDFAITEGGRTVTFRVNKKDFTVDITKYPSDDISIPDILVKDYRRKRKPATAERIYQYNPLASSDYLMLYKDYLSGKSHISPEFHTLLQYNPTSRFESSVYNESDSIVDGLIDILSTQTDSIPQKIVRQMMYIELASSATVSEKDYFYEKYISLLDENNSLWENLLTFCHKKCSSPVSNLNDPTVFEVIGCMPGGINPYTLRLSTERKIYDEAEEKFGKSKFKATKKLLEEAINYEGISEYNLNLTGANYRVLEEPQKAMPYLLLAYMLNPETQFLAGNLVMCLHMLQYPELDLFIDYLNKNITIDAWSKNQIETVQTKK